MYRIVPYSDPKVMKSKWAGQIVAHPFDLANIAEKVNSSVTDPQDAFVSVIGGSSYLRSRRWNNITDENEVLAIISADMATIRGCIDVLDGCGEVQIGTLLLLDGFGYIKKRTRKSAAKLIVLPKQKNRAAPSKLRSMLELASIDPNFHAAVVGFEAFSGWFSVYIAIEACLKAWGGMNAYKTHNPSNGAIIDRSKTTANWHRHASVTYPYPKKATELRDSVGATKIMISETAEMLLLKGSLSTSPLSDIRIPQDPFPAQKSELPRLIYGGRRAYDVAIEGQYFSSKPEEVLDD